MMLLLLGLYVTLSLGAGFLMWAMCRMAAADRPMMLELRIEAESSESDGMVAPTAVAV